MLLLVGGIGRNRGQTTISLTLPSLLPKETAPAVFFISEASQKQNQGVRSCLCPAHVLHSSYPHDKTAQWARPFPIEFDGAVYQITSRGDRRKPIYDDEDRSCFIRILSTDLNRFNTGLIAWCLMGNHYQLVESFPVHAPSERREYSVLQPTPQQGRPSVPGALQGHPRRHRRLPP